MKIILATHNPHKREELIALSGNQIQIDILPDNFPEIPETGNTLQENARIKARFVFERLHQPALADDTGLEVNTLGGAPGVYTARYAGENAGRSTPPFSKAPNRASASISASRR